MQTHIRGEKSPIIVVGRVTWPVPDELGHFISAWPGTSVGVRFQGTGLVARMADTDASPLPDPIGGWGGLANAWDVKIDGEPLPIAVHAQRQVGEVSIARGLMMGEHEVWMTRQTEAPRRGRVEVFGFRAVEGELLPPPTARGRRIEVVGTSVETGLNITASIAPRVKGHDKGLPQEPLRQNQSIAWPKLVGELLAAEVINVSMEGAGLLVGLQSFAGQGVQLPEIYGRADLLVPSPLWDPQKSPVDVVLVAAGWVDGLLLDLSVRANAARLRAAYEDFLHQVRDAQPGAFVYAVVRTGDTRGWPRRAMTKIIKAAVAGRHAANDRHVAILSLPAWSTAMANFDDHPNRAQQQAMAEAAAAQIQLDMGW